MKSLNDIKRLLENKKSYFFKEYPIESLAIFGSYARNAQTENSDLDILVEFNKEIGIRFIDLADEIEELVGFKVDLVSKNGIKDNYYQSINADLIYV
jgi:hypothetical protein